MTESGSQYTANRNIMHIAKYSDNLVEGNVMKSQITRPDQAGSVVRRVREDLGISRAELSRRAEISPRTLFAFEQGQNENIGLAGFLRITAALGLVVSLDDGASLSPGQTAVPDRVSAPFAPDWDRLGDAWTLEDEAK